MTSGGPSKRARPANVELLQVSEINDDPVNNDEHFHKGAKVLLHGLRKLRMLNGQIGTIRHFDFGSGRYVVQISGQAPKSLKPENLQLATGRGRSTQHRQAVGRSTQHRHPPRPSGGGVMGGLGGLMGGLFGGGGAPPPPPADPSSA